MRAANRRLPSDGLNLVVATAPSATAEGRFLEHDLELVRASLLYADTVELLSPAAVLVGGVAAFQAAGPEGWLDVLAELDDATLRHMNVDDPNTFREALGNFREYSSLPRAGRRKQMGSQFAEAERMSDEFRRVLEEPGGPRDQIAMILDQAQAPELGEALEAGVLTLSTDSMTVGADTNTQIREYTATLASLLAKPGTHLLLDERMSGIAESLIDAGEVTPSAATMTRVVRSRVGTGLVAQLPVFPGASIGTILETRAELSEPLARYRGGVKRLSGTVESAPLSAELGAEVADMWRDEVVPAVNDPTRRPGDDPTCTRCGPELGPRCEIPDSGKRADLRRRDLHRSQHPLGCGDSCGAGVG